MKTSVLRGALCVVTALLTYTVNHPVALASSDNLRVTQEQIIILPNAGTYEIVEVQTVKNFGSASEHAWISVPTGALAVTLAGKAVTPRGANRELMWPTLIRPEQSTQISTSFTLDMKGTNAVAFTLHSQIPIDNAFVYLPVGQSEVSAQGLFASTQTESFKGTTFRVFTRQGIQAGEDWSFSLGRLPSALPDKQTHSTLPILGADNEGAGTSLDAALNLALALAVLVIGLFGVRASSTRPRATSYDALFEELKLLELAYVSGQVDERDYTSLKQSTFAKLVDVLRRSERAVTKQPRKSGEPPC